VRLDWGEAEERGQDRVVDGNAEQRETRHQHAGDGARLEGDVEAVAQRLHRRLRRADIGADGDVHADEAGEARQNGADQEADREQPACDNAQKYGHFAISSI
jgi:hypothetical protein